jgi:hypothetical protein
MSLTAYLATTDLTGSVLVTPGSIMTFLLNDSGRIIVPILFRVGEWFSALMTITLRLRRDDGCD